MAPETSYNFVRAGKLHFFCPLCKYHQSTNTIERIQWKHHAQLFLLTVAITILSFPIFGFNGLMLYLVFWGGFEIFYRLRKRQALICQSCGFDPFLYKQDVNKARQALRAHWESRIEKENLFANLKLKNYETARVKGAAALATEEKKNPGDAGVNQVSPRV